MKFKMADEDYENMEEGPFEGRKVKKKELKH